MRWTAKLMGRYGSEKSRKDKEKDAHFGTVVDCSWLLSNFGHFDVGKKRTNVEREVQ